MKIEAKIKDYVDEHILNQVDCRRKYDEKTGEEYYFTTVKLPIIERDVPEDLIPLVFEYLKSKDIYVIGDSRALYTDFDNYIYSNNDNVVTLPKTMPKDEFGIIMKKYKECSDQEEKKLLRNKLIEGNLRLVKQVIKYNYRYGELNKEELESYGYEGLIKAVDNYSLEKASFQTFAMAYIDGYIKKGLNEIRNIKGKSFFVDYLNCKKSLELELGHIIKANEEIDYLDDIIDIYMEIYNSKDTKEVLKRKIYLSEPLPLEEEMLVEEDFSTKAVDCMFIKDVHKDIINSLERLHETSKMVIYHLYELDHDKKEKYDSYIKKAHCDSAYIMKVKARAIKRLRNEECLRKDLEEFGVSPSDKKKKQKTKRKTWNNVIYMV